MADETASVSGVASIAPDAISFKKAVIPRLNLTSFLNVHVLSRCARKIQDILDVKYIHGADPESIHRNGFSNRNSRSEIYTFIDTALNMFANRIPSNIKSAKVEIPTNIELRVHGLRILENVAELSFISDVTKVIDNEVAQLVNTTKTMHEADGYYNPFFFSIQIGDDAVFHRGIADMMHEALLVHYRDVLVHYRDQIAPLSDADRNPVFLPYRGTLLNPESLKEFVAAMDFGFDQQFSAPCLERAQVTMSLPRATSLNVYSSPKNVERPSLIARQASFVKTGSQGNLTPKSPSRPGTSAGFRN